MVRVRNAVVLATLLLPQIAGAAVIPRPTGNAPTTRPLPARAPYRATVLVCLADDTAIQPRANGRLGLTNRLVQTVLERHALPDFVELGVAGMPGRPRFARLDLAGHTVDAAELARELRATGAFHAVCPDYRMELMLVPNDPGYLKQWHVQQTPNDADIQLIPAWNISQGSPTVTIAILDTGVDLTHEDLASRIAVNADEIPANGMDDDDNGFIDDVTGWDFGIGDNDPNPEAIFDDSGLDVGFHGTFCAGLAAAATNNGIGIAGAGFSTRILPIKVADGFDLPLSAVTEGFLYAASRQASVLSMSFGARGEGAPEYFQELVNIAHAAGTLCVAAAGNDGADLPLYPAACENVLSVAATDGDNLRASFSNYGSWVDVAAPGAYLWSTLPWNYDIDFNTELYFFFYFEYDGLTPYMRGDGTSFATPLVAGVAALVRAQHPTQEPDAVAHHLFATGDVVAYDFPIGRKVNALQALTLPVSGVAESGAPPIALIAAAPNPFRGATRIAFELPTASVVELFVHDPNGRLVRTIRSDVFPPGGREIVWDGLGDAGEVCPAGVYFAQIRADGFDAGIKLVRVR